MEIPRIDKPRIRVAGITIQGDEILLIEHTKKDKKYWLVPGGGVDWGESTEQALIREYKEETNLDIEIKDFLFFSEAISPDKNKHVINLYFLVIVKNDSEPMKIGDESNLSDLRYVSKEEIKDIKLYPNIKEQLLKILNNEQMSSYLGLLWDN